MSGDKMVTAVRYPSKYVKLNIGGSLYYTTVSTLQKHDTMLRAMFSGRMEVLTDSEGVKYSYDHLLCICLAYLNAREDLDQF